MKRLQSLCLPVCLCLSLCLSPQQRCSQCGVMGLGLQQQTPLRLTSLLQLHLHPPCYQISRRVCRCDMLLTSHLKPRFTKRDVHGCSSVAAKTDTACTHTHTQIVIHSTQYTMLNHRKERTHTHKYKHIPLHTCPPQSPLSSIPALSERRHLHPQSCQS